ncbi:MAG: UbiD family decarboxylase [bacterium]|nr:UbiD family decarboxylase [bacterium]MCY3651571.1 UbiD family decarboxylase [bacterium]
MSQSDGFGASQDLHDFLEDYQHAHPEDVLVVSEQVEDSQDVAAMVWQMAETGRREMLWFHQIEGIPHQVVTNIFACRDRVARILGTETKTLHETFQERATNLIKPAKQPNGPLLDHTAEGDEINLWDFPMLTHFETDRAPYITSGIIVAEDENGVGNLSYHRAMVNSSNSFATSLHSRGDLWRLMKAARSRGEPLRVAMVLGGHPLFMLAASARVPMDVDERQVAGGLFGAPLEVVASPKYGIKVPATADFLFEGVIRPEHHVEEGPFGEFTGYSSDRSTNSLFQVEVMSARRNPVLLDIVGGNSAEHLNLARIPRESEMADKLKARFPEVVALHYPNSGSHFHCYVQVRARRPGQARQIMLGLLGWDPYLKTVVAVDEDIDITDDGQVLWALATHFQPADDLFVVDGLPGSPLDPSSSLTGVTSRLALDATRGPDFNATRLGISRSAQDRAADLLSRHQPWGTST